jgi:hypothetical protein
MEENMSQDNGQTSVIQKVASRLRGNGELQEGDNVRAEEEPQGEVARLASPQAPKAHHELPHNANPKAAIKLSWGSNASLPLSEIERAVLSRIQVMGSAAGKQDVPGDIMDFMQRANVIFLDQNNQRVSFSRVVVAWGE